MTMISRLFVFILVASAMIGLHAAIPHEWAHAWIDDEVRTAIAAVAPCSDAAHDASHWHPPVDASGCTFGHEHGDAPPQWIADAGYTVGFDDHAGFHGNTSSIENTTKHTSMKGMLATLGSQQVYVRYHIASNFMERSARYHSYEVFMRDASGGVSHWQGWLNSGDPVADRQSKSLPDPGRRPLTLVTDYPALVRGLNCETWYGFTAGWAWDVGLTICDSTTMPYQGETMDPATWVKLCDYGYPPLACKGNDREIELTWYGPDSKVSPNRGSPPRGVPFYATQFGEIVTGPGDARCTGTTAKFGTTYQNICLPQFIATTARTVENPTNRFRKTFDVTGVMVPN
jgi:hypothetical protein